MEETASPVSPTRVQTPVPMLTVTSIRGSGGKFVVTLRMA